MTIGHADTTGGDPAPTTTVPTTGISVSASSDTPDATTADGPTDTVGDTSTDSGSATADDTDATTDMSETTALTATDTGDASTSGGPTTTNGATTDGETTDTATTGGCSHPAGAYGDCLNGGFSTCMNNDSVCLHDDADNPTVGVCSLLDCTDVCDCPAAPATGNAQVTCGDILQGGGTACFLACGAATICPDGMVCASNLLCTWG